MSKVDFTVKQEFEYMKNWKVLQEGFQKAGVKKMIPVEKLIKAKYQDNLEFLQWMYQYAHQVYNGDCDNPQYSALERRSKSKGGKEYGSKFARRHYNSNFKTIKDNNAPKESNNLSSIRQINNNHNINVNNQNHSSSKLEPFVPQSKYVETGHSNIRNDVEDFKRELDELRQENTKLQTHNSVLENKMESLGDVAKDIEKERDFYFNKVLKIESILKDCSDQSIPLIKTIFDILYQVDEEINNENKNTGNIQDIVENNVEFIKQN
jgi:RP/EB family microtubule-associated protein